MKQLKNIFSEEIQHFAWEDIYLDEKYSSNATLFSGSLNIFMQSATESSVRTF